MKLEGRRRGRRDIGADHVQGAVGEVHHARDAEDERQSGAQQEERRAVRQARDELAEDQVHVESDGVAPPALLARVRRTQLFHLGIRRQELRAVGVAPVDHRALAPAQVELAHVGAHRRLVVDAAEGGGAERRAPLQAPHRCDELLRIGRLRLAQRLDDRGEGRVAHHRPQPRIVLVTLVVRGEEL